jgi:hypothetical protein
MHHAPGGVTRNRDTVAAMPERDNRMVWDRGPHHYEVWYATLSHRPSSTGFWIRYVLEAPSDDRPPYAEVWFARFDAREPRATFGIHRRFPITALAATDEPFAVTIDHALVRHDGMTGALEGGGHAASWDLRWRPGEATLRHYPAVTYRIPQIQQKILTPTPATLVDGEIVVDGTRYALAGEPGEQSHTWGSKHSYQWAWGHCNAFEAAPGAVFVGATGQLKRGSVILPRLTLFSLLLDGEEIAFREFWKLPLARSDYATGHYHLLGVTADTRVEARFTCRPDDMLLCEYLDPDGDPVFCHNTCCADATVTVQKRSPFVGRWRDHRVLRSPHSAHFEWAGRAGDVAQVKKLHALV